MSAEFFVDTWRPGPVLDSCSGQTWLSTKMRQLCLFRQRSCFFLRSHCHKLLLLFVSINDEAKCRLQNVSGPRSRILSVCFLVPDVGTGGIVRYCNVERRSMGEEGRVNLRENTVQHAYREPEVIYMVASLSLFFAPLILTNTSAATIILLPPLSLSLFHNYWYDEYCCYYTPEK